MWTELTAARRHWEKESPREASWALPYSLSSPTTSPETFLVKSWEPYVPTSWSYGAQRTTLRTIDCRGWTSWKIGQNGGLSKSTPGRPPVLSSVFRQRSWRPTCISMVRLCLLRATPPTWGWLSTSGWQGNNKLRKQKPEPRCDLPSWRSWQAQLGAQILWLSQDCTLLESVWHDSKWHYSRVQLWSGQQKNRTRPPTSSQARWSQRR